MSLGPTVRRLLGPLESTAADRYRRFFIDLDDLARTLGRLTPVTTILEVGAGDGCLATRLLERFPRASYLGIDIASSPGRLFDGDARRAAFLSQPVEDLDDGRLFDLVVLVDVLHHVPGDQRSAVLAGAAAHVRPGGFLAIKDWVRGRNLGHLLAYTSDRYITGDANVAFFEREELLELIARSVPTAQVTFEAHVPPRRNNLLLLLQAPAA
jgi:2-polyprenyl-6-hydroxyphenyl methylase/3-demethylubiquinone-9 3-methyltransferase